MASMTIEADMEDVEEVFVAVFPSDRAETGRGNTLEGIRAAKPILYNGNRTFFFFLCQPFDRFSITMDKNKKG